MKDSDDFLEFLEGGEIPVKEKNDFSDVYLNLIKQSQTIKQPGFDLFEKVKKTQKIERWKRFSSYAAVLIFTVVLSSVIYSRFYSNSQSSHSQTQIAEAKNNTVYALSYFSKEWNKTLSNFKEASRLNQPIREFKNLKKSTIEFDNPSENVKSDTL